MRTFGLIPAAGKSRRMGQPKLLLQLGTTSVLELVVSAVRGPCWASRYADRTFSKPFDVDLLLGTVAELSSSPPSPRQLPQ